MKCVKWKTLEGQRLSGRGEKIAKKNGQKREKEVEKAIDGCEKGLKNIDVESFSPNYEAMSSENEPLTTSRMHRGHSPSINQLPRSSQPKQSIMIK